MLMANHDRFGGTGTTQKRSRFVDHNYALVAANLRRQPILPSRLLVWTSPPGAPTRTRPAPLSAGGAFLTDFPKRELHGQPCWPLSVMSASASSSMSLSAAS